MIAPTHRGYMPGTYEREVIGRCGTSLTRRVWRGAWLRARIIRSNGGHFEPQCGNPFYALAWSCLDDREAGPS